MTRRAARSKRAPQMFIAGSIDPLNEELLSLRAAGELLRIDGEVVTPNSLHKWRRDGLMAHDGRRVQLCTIKLRGNVYTTRRAMRAFFEAISPMSPYSAAREAHRAATDGIPQVTRDAHLSKRLGQHGIGLTPRPASRAIDTHA